MLRETIINFTPDSLPTMIIRLTQKMASRLEVRPSAVLPLADDRLCDWSLLDFVYAQKQYFVLANTASFYCTIISNVKGSFHKYFPLLFNRSLESLFDEGGRTQNFQQRVVPSLNEILYCKHLNRSVLSSLNQIVVVAKGGLERNVPIDETAAFCRNKFWMSAIAEKKGDYAHPVDAFRAIK